MNENLNLVELLKDCPQGTKFYSRCLGSVEFCKITLDNYIEVIGKNGYYIGFKPNGTYQHSEESTEIDLFPSKDQRDWSKWQRPFVDGDIITYMFWRKPTTYIYRENGTHNTSYYVAYSSENNKLYDDGKGALTGNRHDLRFATEEEKQKLFDIIKEKGYKWNSKTKTLEKLIVPKFKVGDKIRHKTANIDYVLEISRVYDDSYGIVGCGWMVSMEYQNEYELVPNRFNPKTLKPFDKVLVSCNDEWFCDFFSHYDDAVDKFNCTCTGGCPYEYCIPYNDDTKHLIGKSIEDAPEFYRYWEE